MRGKETDEYEQRFVFRCLRERPDRNVTEPIGCVLAVDPILVIAYLGVVSRLPHVPTGVRPREIIVHVLSDIDRVVADGMKWRDNRVVGKGVKGPRCSS